ncbi:MAG: hypothetical protein KDJ37_08415 [Hyphomicrobiaceae bacterium]|nr:hypothetical protein [Hyphomicrobiaceae bacterium]
MSAFASLYFAMAATGTIFSDYPVFVNPHATVEAWTDLGPIVELIVKCPAGTGIVSYSKIDRRFCSSKHACFSNLSSARHDTCG